MLAVKWFDINECEYPDLPCDSDEVTVWVSTDGYVEIAIYRNPSMDCCYFVDVDGYELEDIYRWAPIIKPYPPNI